MSHRPIPSQAPDPRLDPRQQARGLYWQGWGITAIAKHLHVAAPTVYSWKHRGNWDGGTPVQRVLASTEARLIQLINLGQKSDGVYKEIGKLTDLVAKLSGKKAVQDDVAALGEHMPDANAPPVAKPSSVLINPKPSKNYFSPEHLKQLRDNFMDCMAPHQKVWYDQRQQRIRNVIKSRQIGATFHFSREGLMEALHDGHNQIFLSASLAQVYQSKLVIMDFAAQVGVELSGKVITLGNNGASLYFISTNARTAQSRTGHVKFDEYMWMTNFKQLKSSAAAMASHSPLTQTFFSTAAYDVSEPYTFWSGEHYNIDRPESEKIKLDVRHQALKAGRLDPDLQWRQMVTIEDAISQGFSRFDLDFLKATNSVEEFRQLFMCEFIAQGAALFTLKDMQARGVDSWHAWNEFYKPLAARPLGHAPVWIGYDPSEHVDGQALVVLKAPMTPGDKFYLIEKKIMYGNDYEAQADAILAYLSIYNVNKIVIDTNGLGTAVYQRVIKKFPAIGLKWNADEKARMIFKMQSILRQKRFEFEQTDMDTIAAFMSIRRVQLNSGRITYGSTRNDKTSHGDLAWAIIMTIAQEPLAENFDQTDTIEVI